MDLKKLTKLGVISLNGNALTESEVKDGDIIQCLQYHISVSLKNVPCDSSNSEASPEGKESPSSQKSANLEESIKNEDQEKDGDKKEAEIESIESEEEFETKSEFQEITPNENEENEEISSNEEGQEINSEGEFFNEEGEFQEDSQEEFNDSDNDVDQDMESSLNEIEPSDKTEMVKSFVEFELDISGEHCNFDKYYIRNDEIFIGRDTDKCQITLDDPECSQVHAVIRRKGTHCELEDLDSTNGVILNGLRINQSRLSHGDEFLVGSTSFRLSVKSDLISAEKNRLMPVQEIEEVEVEKIIEEEISDDQTEGGHELALESSDLENEYDKSESENLDSSNHWLKNPEKRKKLIIYSVLLVGLWVFLDEEKPESKKKEGKEEKNRDLFKDGSDSEKNKSGSKRSYEKLPKDIQEYVRTNYELGKNSNSQITEITNLGFNT